jgi:ketosteroid isomerase-like protein
VTEAAERFRDCWIEFVRAHQAGDDAAALPALASWIEAWDECFWKRDFSAFEVAYWPDVEIVNRTRLFGVRERNGIEGLRALRDDVPDVVSNFRFEITGMRRAGDRVIGLGRFRARARYTGILIRLPLAVAWTIRDGRISRIEPFTSRRRALAATGAVTAHF